MAGPTEGTTGVPASGYPVLAVRAGHLSTKGAIANEVTTLEEAMRVMDLEA